MPWPLIISALIFAVGVGIAARDDDGFAWWKPLVLAAAIVAAGWGLGQLVLKTGNSTQIWFAATALFGAAGAFAVRFLLKCGWLHAVISGVVLVLIEFGIQKAWEYILLS